jgi:hypothetical protein
MRARFPVGGGGGGSGQTAQWQTLDFNDATLTDLGSGGVLTALSRVEVNGTVGVQATFNGAISAGTIAAQARVVFPLKDCFGNALATLGPWQVAVFAVQLLDAALPGSCRIGAALQDGTAASPVNGLYAGVEKHVTNGNFCQRSQSPNTSTWAAPTSASSADFISRSWVGKVVRGASATAVGFNAFPFDGSRQPSRVAASSPAVYSGNGAADFTHLVLRFGANGALGTNSVVRVAIKLFVYDVRDQELMQPYALPTPTISKPTSGETYDIAIVGHSMANGFYADPTYAGAAVAAGWSFYEDNTLTANWPTGVGFEQSLLPSAIVELNAIGVTPSTIHRRASNGQAIVDGAFDTELGQVVQDCFNRGITPKTFWVWHGANDGQNAGEAAAFLVRLRLVVEMIRLYYPNASIVLLGEHVTAGGYSEIATVQAHKQTVAAEYPGVYFISATSPGNITLGVDNVHPDAAGNTTMAQRTIAALVA